MKIPAHARSASSDTPGVGRRPPEWVDSEGRQVLSHADTLFSAPVAPGELVSNGWGEVDALALTEHIGRRVIQGCKSRDFRDGWRKNPDTGKVSPRVYPRTTLDENEKGARCATGSLYRGGCGKT